MKLVLRSESEAETDAVAARVAAALRGGELIALEGQMGAGKTRFVRGLVRALGGDVRQVSSPTFVLMNVYDTARLRVFHLDAYRISGEEELESIGFSEVTGEGGVVVVEWASRVAGVMRETRKISIQIDVIGETGREFVIEGLVEERE